MQENEAADRMERAVNSCRESAMATGGAKWVEAVDVLISAIRAATLSKEGGNMATDGIGYGKFEQTAPDPLREDEVASRLTAAQRAVLLAIRPGEERRAIDFSGSTARGLMWATRRRPPLTTMTLTPGGQAAWFRLTHDGCAARAAILRLDQVRSSPPAASSLQP